MKKKIIAMSLVFCLIATTAIGCSKKKSTTPKDDITKITIWNYYNGAQLESFNHLVDEFNKTVGKEKGISVEAASQGSVEDLQKNVLDSINGVAGAEKVPNIFAAYSDTAYEIDKMGKLVDLKQYFSDKELDEYVPGYIEEGYFNGSDELKILPLAKSTEILYINYTDWMKFATATGSDLSELATYEGVTDIAQKYYEWTDSLTETPYDGKAFLGRDAMANFFIVGSKQFGIDIFDVQSDGSVKINFDETVMRKIWDNYYIPYIKGYFTLSGRFGSDDVKTGTTIAFIGSTSGASFFPEEVSISDTETYTIENQILPCPIFEGQKPVSVQQGAGMAVTKSTKEEEQASVEFLKWFTEDEHNMQFSVASGYLPVKKVANNKQVISQYTDSSKATLVKTIDTGIDVVNSRDLYTSSAFNNASDARNLLTYCLSELAQTDRETIEHNLDSGMSYEESIAPYLTDDYFKNWYDKTKDELEKCVE